MNTDLNHLSRVITALRFPLIVLVVLIHVSFQGDETAVLNIGELFEGENLYYYTTKVISYGLGRAAVPAFFLFSGYYFFFKNPNHLDVGNYRNLVKQKSSTLFLPYLIWAIVPFFLKYAITQLLPNASSLVPEFEVPVWYEWLYQALWKNLYNYPLWYLRDLIVLTLCSPLIYLLAKRFPYVLIPLFALCLLDINLVIYSGSIFYFLLGAVCGIRHIDILAYIRPYRVLLHTLAILGTLLLPFTVAWDYHKELTNLYIPTLLASMLLLMSSAIVRYPRFSERMQALAPSVFFIYTVHSVLILALVKGLSSALGMARVVHGYFFRGILVLLLSWLTYIIFKHCFPRFLSLLNGGRA